MSDFAVFFLLPPRRWVTAAGTLSLLRQLPCCSWGRGPDSKSVDVVLEICLLLLSRWATAVEVSGVADLTVDYSGDKSVDFGTINKMSILQRFAVSTRTNRIMLCERKVKLPF